MPEVASTWIYTQIPTFPHKYYLSLEEKATERNWGKNEMMTGLGDTFVDS